MSETEHVSVATYWKICGILCALTFIEWIIFHFPSLRSNAMFMYSFLGVLSIAKFLLVVKYYMHLKYDDALLSKVFYFSTFLAVIVFTIYLLVL